MDAREDLRNLAPMASDRDNERIKQTRQEAAREYIQIVLDTLNMKPTHLAELIDVHPSTINRPVSGAPMEHAVSVGNLLKIREKTNVKFTDFVVRAYNLPTSFMPGDAPLTEPLANRRSLVKAPEPMDPGAEMAPNVRDAPLPPKPLHGRPDQVPVMGTAQGGPDGTFELNTGEPIDFVDRPARLAQRQGIYAIYLEGESMTPAYEPGDLVFVDSTRKPWVGRDALVELHPKTENDPPRAFLKRIAVLNSEFVELKEFKPVERTFRLPRSAIKAMHLVLRNTDMY